MRQFCRRGDKRQRSVRKAMKRSGKTRYYTNWFMILSENRKCMNYIIRVVSWKNTCIISVSPLQFKILTKKWKNTMVIINVYWNYDVILNTDAKLYWISQHVFNSDLLYLIFKASYFSCMNNSLLEIGHLLFADTVFFLCFSNMTRKNSFRYTCLYWFEWWRNSI